MYHKKTRDIKRKLNVNKSEKKNSVINLNCLSNNIFVKNIVLYIPSSDY